MSLAIEIDLPEELASFELPEGVDRRLQNLLDKQDQGVKLTPNEQSEAVGLVSLAEMLSLLNLRSKRAS